MSDDVKAKLEERLKVLQEEFNALEAKRKEAVESRTNLDKAISEIQARQVQLKGAFQEVNLLLTPVVEGEVVKKKK